MVSEKGIHHFPTLQHLNKPPFFFTSTCLTIWLSLQQAAKPTFLLQQHNNSRICQCHNFNMDTITRQKINKETENSNNTMKQPNRLIKLSFHIYILSSAHETFSKFIICYVTKQIKYKFKDIKRRKVPFITTME